MQVSELDTPALLVDLDIMERNLRRVAGYAAEHNLRLRPHTKTHKYPEIARRQLSLGAAGLTVAKVGEAEVMLDSGTSDLLVAYPVIGSSKLERLMKVARHTKVTVALDSAAAAQQLSVAAKAAGVEAGVLVEVDAGLGRVGVTPDEALDLARAVLKMPGLRFRGIAFYPGHIKDPEGSDAAELPKLSALTERMLADFEAAGLKAEIVSGGSTPALFHSHRIAGLNEIRPGTYVFNDLNTVRSGGCTLDDCAAAILVAVISKPREGSLFIDGGSKTFSSDRSSAAGRETFGRIVEAPGCEFYRMNEEHGFVDTHADGRQFSIGDKLRIIPNHVCVAVNLHETVYGIRGEKVEKTWKVAGRGKLQ
ncbi:MAG: alanine racemase [Acidobacteriota bacterium]|nr:alanine racemase [Acidobacteriota bacterium]